MSGHATKTGEVSSQNLAKQNGKLRRDALGPIETLAQSISAVAPSTSPSLTIPLVFALAGNATCFVYLLAMGAILLVGYCVSRFAQLSASPGSLYSYTAETLPPIFGATAAWGLLLAYLGTGASVAGGAAYYSELFGKEFLHRTPTPVATLVIVCAVGAYIAWRDVKLSAEMMLWMEAASVGFIVLVLSALPFRLGVHLDAEQFLLRGRSFSSVGPALVLAMFSFVGFESATTLGGEVQNPLRTIPRAVIQCALIAGAFFALCAYSEVLGFRSNQENLASSTSPLHLLAIHAGLAPLGTLVDIGAMISMVACVLACTTAAARVLLRMAQDGLLPRAFGAISRRHGTPWLGVIVSAALMMLFTVVMSLSGTSGAGIYDLMGSLAVFGYLTAYALVAIALVFARGRFGSHSLMLTAVGGATFLVIIMIVFFDLRSAADAAHGRIPVIYLLYIASGIVSYAVRRNLSAAKPPQD